MSGASDVDQGFRRLEDLDVAATAYAADWARASPGERSRLRDRMICRCLPFAGRMARRYGGRGEPFDDLEQVARLALVKAVDRYNPDRGSFTAFAVITICGEIKRYFRDKTWGVHVVRRLQDLALDINRATAILTNELARTPTVGELTVYLEVDEDVIVQALECSVNHTPLSLSRPTTTDGGLELGDVVGRTDNALDMLTDKLAIAELVQLLPDRIQRMLTLRFYGNLTQAQIAAEFGLSQMHVSRLLARGLSWLRAAMVSDTPPLWDGTDAVRRYGGMHLKIVRNEDAVTVTVSGEVDRDTADRLRFGLHRAIVMADGGRVVIDLAGMPLIDAAGAAVFNDARVKARLAGVTVTLTGMQRYVQPVIAAIG